MVICMDMKNTVLTVGTFSGLFITSKFTMDAVSSSDWVWAALGGASVLTLGGAIMAMYVN